MEDRCYKKEKCMNVWNPCAMNCSPMCPMMMHPCMMAPDMKPVNKSKNEPSMMKCPMMQPMAKCPMLESIPRSFCPQEMMDPMMMDLPVGCNMGYMKDRMMPQYENINRVEEPVPYVTMRTVRVEDIED